MPRLSNTMVQSVKLRASGADSYLQPSPLPTKFESLQLHPDAYQPQVPPEPVNGDDGSAERHSRTYSSSSSTLPSLSGSTVSGVQNVDGASTSFSRLGKRSNATIAADQGLKEDGSSLQASSRLHSAHAPNSETRRVSLVTTSSTSRSSSVREGRLELLHSEDSISASEHGYSTMLDSRAVAPIQLLSVAAASTASAAVSVTSSEATVKKKRVRIKTERRREQCRANQARYRNKQRALRLEFHETLERLRGEVRELEAERRALANGLHIKKSPWNVVADYFRLFHRGACIRKYAGASSPAHNSVHSLYTESEIGKEQLAFLHAVMSPDVNLVENEADGVDALAEQWVVWSQSCSAFEMHLKSIEKVPGQPDTLVASTIVSVMFSDSTIRSVFPHLPAPQNRSEIDHEEQSSDSELALKLCGRRLEFKCVMWFECHPRTNQVLRLRSQFDTIPPLLDALGSLQDVAQVLDGARLSADGFIR
jgi:hypothetical protein